MNPDGAVGESEKLLARVSALEQLLGVYEALVIQQAERLESALDRLTAQAEVLSAVVAGTDPSAGPEFFRSLVYRLGMAVHVRYALVGELLPGGKERIRTLAVWAGGRFVDNFEYDLAGTPCAQVLRERFCYFPSGLRQRFPASALPAGMNAEAYCGAVLANAAGQPLGVLGLLHDEPIRTPFDLAHVVTLFATRAGVELGRRRVEERTRAILQTALDGFCELDRKGNIVEVNEAFGRLTGYGRDELLAMNVHDLEVAEELHAVSRTIQRIVQSGGDRFETCLRRQDGTPVDVDVSIRYLDQGGGRFFCFLRDITERKQLEAALRDSVERFDLAVRGSQDGLWDGHKAPDLPWYDPQTPVWWSPRVREMLGYEEHEFPNVLGSWTPLLHPEDRDRVFAVLFDHIERRMPYDVEYRLRTKAGGYRWFRAKGQAIWDKAENVLRMSGSLSDITDRKEAEEELRVTNRMLTALVRSSPMAIVIIDLQGKVKLWNPAAERIFGWREDEAVGHMLPFIPPDKREEHLALRDRVLRDESFAGLEVIRRRKNGALLHAELSTALLRDDKGLPYAILCLLADITERKRAEETLRQRERDLRTALEERQRLSQDLHDDILQSLYAVGLNLEACKPPRKQDPRRARKTLDRAVAQLNDVMREIRSFITGLNTESAMSHELPTALRTMVQALARPHAMRFRVIVDTEVTASVPEDWRGHLLNVAKEAVSNCLRHARADRGSLSLRVLRDCVRLTVQDNGIGFDPKKATGVGHGLANMAARAERLGGKFMVLSKPRQGTRVVFEIPKDAPNAEP